MSRMAEPRKGSQAEEGAPVRTGGRERDHEETAQAAGAVRKPAGI